MIAGRFPDHFLWGTATAAHQVEGGNHANDWWAWEQVPGHIKNGDRSDRACEHYERYASDFDLLRSLHQNAHRLSLEWSRIEPAPGEFSATVSISPPPSVLATINGAAVARSSRTAK